MKQTDTSRSREAELKEESAGFVDEWNIRDEKDVHPSHKTEVWTKEEISRLTAHWLQAGIQQGYAKAYSEMTDLSLYKRGKEDANKITADIAERNFKAGKQEGIKQGKAQEQERILKIIDKLDTSWGNRRVYFIRALKREISKIKEL